MAFDMLKEVKLALIELLKPYEVSEKEIGEIAEELCDRIKAAKSDNKFGAVYMTESASRNWDKMKRGEKKTGPGARPESV